MALVKVGSEHSTVSAYHVSLTFGADQRRFLEYAELADRIVIVDGELYETV